MFVLLRCNFSAFCSFMRSEVVIVIVELREVSRYRGD